MNDKRYSIEELQHELDEWKSNAKSWESSAQHYENMCLELRAALQDMVEYAESYLRDATSVSFDPSYLDRIRADIAKSWKLLR